MKCLTGERTVLYGRSQHGDQTDEQLEAQRSKFSCSSPTSPEEMNSDQDTASEHVRAEPQYKRGIASRHRAFKSRKVVFGKLKQKG